MNLQGLMTVAQVRKHRADVAAAGKAACLDRARRLYNGETESWIRVSIESAIRIC